MSPASLSLEHLVRPSSVSSKRPPVLFMLHGYGSNEEDLFSFASEMPKEFCIISIRAPYHLDPFGHAWYSINFDAEYGKWNDVGQAKESIGKILVFMDEAIKTYGLDHENVSLLGFSQGTILSYAIALSYPSKVKNVIALSGYVDENMLSEDFADKDHSQLDFYCSHGQVDQVIPLEWAQKAPDFLKRMGITFKYEEFPVGHGVAPQNFYSFKSWLEQKI